MSTKIYDVPDGFIEIAENMYKKSETHGAFIIMFDPSIKEGIMTFLTTREIMSVYEVMYRHLRLKVTEWIKDRIDNDDKKA